ncbi:MAG: sulfatase, partial [Bdellovibrionaceae bacterium]|nr:sulfatase [Pseudobdellovibrionaceae bacterium]
MQHGPQKGSLTLAKLSPRLLRVWSLFLWSVVVLSLIRIEYVLWNLPQLKSQPVSHLFKAMLVGVRFDLAAAAWLILPLVLLTLIPWPLRWNRIWSGAVLTLFLLIQIPFWIVNLIDVEFVNFVGRRMTSDVLFILGEAQGKAGGFVSAYGLLLLFGVLMTAIGAVGGAVIFQWSKDFRWGRDWGWKRRALLGLFSVIALVVMTRGGFQKKPLHFVNAQIFQYPGLNLVVLNSTFTVLKSIGQKQVPKLT